MAALVLASALTASCAARGAPTPSPGGDVAVVSSPESDRADRAACKPANVGIDQLAQSIVFVGEIHGTSEFPSAFAGIVCETHAVGPSGSVLVALELPVRMQNALDAFMATGAGSERTAILEDPFWRREFQDGRSSLAMVDLITALQRMKADGVNLHVRAIDTEEGGQKERDAGMAAAIARAIGDIRPTRTLAYVGNVHSRPIPGYPWDAADPFRSTAALLRDSMGDVASIDLKAEGGSAWTCVTSSSADCAPRALPDRRLNAAPGRLVPLANQDGTPVFRWSLIVGRVSASPPARGPSEPGRQGSTPG